MRRIGWGRAFAFSALAIGIPWIIVATIAAVLIGLSEGSPVSLGVVPLSALIAVLSTVLGGIFSALLPPRSRTSAVVRAWISCVVATFGFFLVVGAVTADFEFSFVAGMVATMIFCLGGGMPWIAAGALGASRILPLERTLGPHWIPLAWSALGLVVAACAIAIPLTAGAPADMTAFETFAPAPERGAWNWFPLGWEWVWGENTHSPGMTPTFVFADGLGLVALGPGLWLGRRGPDSRS